jgi:hypothetical protein
VGIELGPLPVGAGMSGAAGLADPRHYRPLGGDPLREAVDATQSSSASTITQPGTLPYPPYPWIE